MSSPHREHVNRFAPAVVAIESAKAAEDAAREAAWQVARVEAIEALGDLAELVAPAQLRIDGWLWLEKIDRLRRENGGQCDIDIRGAAGSYRDVAYVRWHDGWQHRDTVKETLSEILMKEVQTAAFVAAMRRLQIEEPPPPDEPAEPAKPSRRRAWIATAVAGAASVGGSLLYLLG